MALRSDYQLATAPDWLPDDTEESVLGTEWHQEAVHILADMLRDVAYKRGLPWGVYEQVELRGVRRANGKPYPLHPDVFVVAQTLDPTHDVRSVALAQVGAPLFVAEMASRSTVRNDIEGKSLVYARIGVPEYLIFDPTGDVMGRQVRAWRVASGQTAGYQPWDADAGGYWRSDILGVSLRPQPRYLAVRDGDGEEIGLPVDNGARARAAERALREVQEAAERALREAREATQREVVARLAAEEALRQLRARLTAEQQANDQQDQ
ncbi:MAG: Uma2 family endonuclease [Chloroflexota bacterium]|nr:Uma2 family endonuclease [Chloroflexota bacterium]